MRFARLFAVLWALLWITWGSSGICAEDDYVAKKGLEFYQRDLQNLLQQVLALGPSDRDQKDFLDKLFQLKYMEVERLFDMVEQRDVVKGQVAELCVLKSVESHALGNWIQAYFALKDAESWNQNIGSQSLKIAGKPFDVTSFAERLEKEMLENGTNVRFLIRPFPQDKMFRPDKVMLTRTQAEAKKVFAQARPDGRFAGIESDVSTTVGSSSSSGKRPADSSTVTDKDREFLAERLRKGLYKFFYNPTEENSDFSLYLPNGDYSVRDKEFALHPVDFEVTGAKTQVVLEPARWFRLSFSEEVHPSEIAVVYQGAPWTDLAHVPFGRCRIEVRNKGYAYPFVKVTFAPKGETFEQPGTAAQGQESEACVAVEDRGACRLTLKERDGSEKFRYSLLGY